MRVNIFLRGLSLFLTATHFSCVTEVAANLNWWYIHNYYNFFGSFYVIHEWQCGRIWCYGNLDRWSFCGITCCYVVDIKIYLRTYLCRYRRDSKLWMQIFRIQFRDIVYVEVRQIWQQAKRRKRTLQTHSIWVLFKYFIITLFFSCAP